jgi:two-component sensor histidine kinase
VQVAVGLVLLFLTLFVALFGYFIAVGMNQTQQRFQDRSSAAAQVAASNGYWIGELATQTLFRVDTALGPTMSSDPETLLPAIEGLPSIMEVYIIDDDANTIYATVPGAEGVMVDDREYFTTLRDGEEFYTSPMIVSRLTGARIFVFSKRVVRNGRFAGAIMVSYSGTLLEEMWHALDLGEGSTISFVRSDGHLMARYPPADAPVDLSALPLFTDYLPAASFGTYTSDSSPVDGIARVVSYRAVPGTSIIALAAVATYETWRGFINSILIVLLITSPVVLGLGLGCWWIVVLLNRDSKNSQRLTMLFREIHHRVKNNMASVQALVRMQNIPAEAKRDLESRFAAMAAMHELIYRRDGYDSVDARELVPAVVTQVNAAYGSAVSIRYDLAEVQVGHDQGTPLALLLSELVTNALKYAFSDGRAGTISISLTSADEAGRSTLIVRDNGVGMPLGEVQSSMGMRLIRGVVAQLFGDYEFRNDGGAVFEAKVCLTRAPPS